jgi:hypothetical protein
MRHSYHAQAAERDDDSLFGALCDDDNGSDAVGARDANQQIILNLLGRSAKDTAKWTSLQSQKRYRSASSRPFSSGDESDSSDSSIFSRKKVAQSSSP